MAVRRKKTSSKGLSRREILRYGLYGGLAAGLSGSLWLSGCGKRPQGKGPNIVFILIDALRADRLGTYGHPGGYSPTLDAIAAKSVVFERAIAQAPWTQPSIASLFCSRYPMAHKVMINFGQLLRMMNRKAKKVAIFSDSFVTLAEVLQKAGYATAAFMANPFILREFGFAQGFKHFDASFAWNTTPGNVVNDAMFAWLRQRNKRRPFFCFLHYMDVHGPYNAGPEFLDSLLDKVEAMPDKRELSKEELKKLGYLFKPPKVYTDMKRHKRLSVYQEYWVARYDSVVREVDYHLGKLKVRLEEMGLWDDAYVIITADHGEALMENGYWDHGFSVYHPELHVPLFLRWPGVLATGERIRATVRLIDLMPTLIDQLGLPVVNGLQGRSLMGDITGGGSNKAVTAFAEGVKKGPKQQTVYLGDWKLIITLRTGRRELYNVADDPLEQDELSEKFAGKVEDLTRILQRQVAVNKQLGAGVSVEETLLTPEQTDRLRSLGYVE